MSVWQDLKVKLLDERDKPPRKWDKDDATALQRMAKTKAWALYLTMIDAEVKLLSERLLNEDPAKMPLTVAEIKGLRKMPEKLNLIFREMESHERRRIESERAAELAKSRGISALLNTPFWNSGDGEST
ncbi:MAG: hypothetical protein ACYTAO_04235 [Planctomycetota bacterium]|jgi:hypothetical protein